MCVYKCDLCGKDLEKLTFDVEKQKCSMLHYNANKNAGIVEIVEIDMCQDCFDKMIEEYIKPRLKFENSIRHRIN